MGDSKRAPRAPSNDYPADVLLRTASVLALSVLSLTACGSDSDSGTRDAVSSFTCCTAHDVNRVYHPGDLVTLHWIRETSMATGPSEPTPLTLTAHLDGAFAVVAEAKAPGARGTDPATAVPVHVTDRTMKSPISTFRIPAGAGPGLYNLTTRVASPHGSVSGGTIIRVTPR